MRYYIIDAFADELFGGNPAGVILVEGGDFPPFEVMKKTSAELRYSESVFAKHIKDDLWELKYFTPTDEVDLCGHATIAAFSVIGKEFSSKKKYRAKTKAGEIGIEIIDDIIMMDMVTPQIIEEIEDELIWGALRKILGLEPEKEFGTGEFQGLTPAKVSTGLPDILFPVNSPEDLNAVTPDFEAMSRLSERQKVVGVHTYVLTKEGDDIKIQCRNFAPLYGIPEEAATGTSNGALTYYLYEKGIIKENELNTIVQGSSMDRPSKIVTQAVKDENDRIKIKVGGSAVKLAEGEIFI